MRSDRLLGYVLGIVILIVIVLGAMFVVNMLSDKDASGSITSLHEEDDFVEDVVYDNQVENLEKELVMLRSQLRTYRENPGEEVDGEDLTIVVKAENGIKLENARIRIRKDGSEIFSTYFTDEYGWAKVFNLRKDCYEIEVKKTGYETKKAKVCMSQDRDLKLVLVKE